MAKPSGNCQDVFAVQKSCGESIRKTESCEEVMDEELYQCHILQEST